MNKNTEDKVRIIKQAFHLSMNGMTSHSMRSKGINYKINWGVPFVNLLDMAAEYGKDYSLAVELWKEDIRECKILATLIMPYEEMTEELAELWMEQTPNQEIAEMAAYNLYQHLPFAPKMAFRWAAKNSDLYQIAAYNIFSKLFSNNCLLEQRSLEEFFNQALTAIQDNNIGVRHAAQNSLLRLSSINSEYEQKVQDAMKRWNMDVF